MSRIKSLYIIISAIVALIVESGLHSAGAGQVEDANQALSHHDFPAALKLLQPLADHGDANAQERMGDLFLEGLGVRQDDAEAIKWYFKAADQGNVEALLFAEGKDSKSWFKYYKPGLSDEGAGPRDFNSGNYKDALKELQPYASTGSSGQEYMVAKMYENGLGVDKDAMKAYIWYSRAESSAQRQGFNANDDTPQHLKDIAPTLSPEQLKTAKRIATLWNTGTLPRSFTAPGGKRVFDLDKEVSSALDGNQESQFELGYRSETGNGMKQDYQEAYFWYSLGGGLYDHTPGAYLRREYMTTLLTPDQIAAQDHRIEDWKKAHPVDRR